MTDIYLTISLSTHNGDNTPQNYTIKYDDDESKKKTGEYVSFYKFSCLFVCSHLFWAPFISNSHLFHCPKHIPKYVL